jgi:hypothetical protein
VLRVPALWVKAFYASVRIARKQKESNAQQKTQKGKTRSKSQK